MAIDATGRAAGRGAYLCADAACWDTAARKRSLEHALGTPLPGAVTAALAAGPVTSNTDPSAGTQAPAPEQATIEGGRSGQE